MKNIKEFYTEHKTKILIVAGITTTVAISIVAYRYGKKSAFRGKNAIVWTPGKETMTIDTVLEVLEANKNNNATFAIVRDGANQNGYQTIILSNGFEFPEKFKKVLEEVAAK